MKFPDGSYSGHILNQMCVSCREHTEKGDPSEKNPNDVAKRM